MLVSRLRFGVVKRPAYFGRNLQDMEQSGRGAKYVNLKWMITKPERSGILLHHGHRLEAVVIALPKSEVVGARRQQLDICCSTRQPSP